nr:LuxR C-terminal-related transcriptional regulator [Falsiroseomonas tokyonensis]
MTPRDRDVLMALLGGEGNKEIGRRLGISHRTVEIHRGRVMAKLNAGSAIELLRRLMIVRDL